jgi:hypothetical protein
MDYFNNNKKYVVYSLVSFICTVSSGKMETTQRNLRAQPKTIKKRNTLNINENGSCLVAKNLKELQHQYDLWQVTEQNEFVS